MGSFFGRYLTVTTFGESHGAAVGVVVDGLPAGLAVDPADIQRDLDRRRPGVSPYVSPRREPDAPRNSTSPAAKPRKLLEFTVPVTRNRARR